MGLKCLTFAVNSGQPCSSLQRGGCDQGVAKLQSVTQSMLVDQAHGALTDGFAQRHDLCVSGGQAFFETRQLRPVAAALRKFDVGDGADTPYRLSRQTRRRAPMPVREPNHYILINQHGA